MLSHFPRPRLDVEPIKLQGLRTYRSQADAQELAVLFESDQFSQEWFYQAYPTVSPTAPPASGFEESRPRS